MNDLLGLARRHARRAHGIDLSDEQILWLSRPAVTGPSSATQPATEREV